MVVTLPTGTDILLSYFFEKVILADICSVFLENYYVASDRFVARRKIIGYEKFISSVAK